MNFKFALTLLSALSVVQGDTLRGAGDAKTNALAWKISDRSDYNETVGQCIGATCGVWGDPHIVTCDGLGYNCQGIGLMNIMENHMYDIQGRFLQAETRTPTSITNDVMIKFKQNDKVPVLHLGFGDLSNHDGTFIGEEGCETWTTFEPKSMPNSEGRRTKSLKGCRKYCESTTGCTDFSYYYNGWCYLNNGEQTKVKVRRMRTRPVAGSMIGDCGRDRDLPLLLDPLEESFHREMFNNCPLLMHVDGTLIDLPKLTGTMDTQPRPEEMLLGTKDDDFYVKVERNKNIYLDNRYIFIVYKLENGETAEIKLVINGHGPGAIFSCHWDMFICLPQSQEATFKKGGLGLLGTPNGNTEDDWMNVDGSTVARYTNDGVPYDGTDYCIENWCVSEEDSLFAYSNETSYEDIKCEREEYVETFSVTNDDCVLAPELIIDACKDMPPLMIHACEVDCCAGGCDQMPEVEAEITEVIKLSDREEDIQYQVPVHDQCDSRGFLNTGDIVCPALEESTVKLMNEPTFPLPEDGTVIYGIVHDTEDEGKSIKFRVNNPFPGEANIYVKHEKSVHTTFMDTVCDDMPGTVSGCDTSAEEIEVACRTYTGVAPFALVEIYFQSDYIPPSSNSVKRCCDPIEDASLGVAVYTFEIQCGFECPEDMASA